MHDHFFASDRDAELPPPPPQPLSGRLRNAFEDNEFDGSRRAVTAASRRIISPRLPARDYGEPAQRHHGVHGFDETQDFEWDKYEQPPAPTSVRPFHPPATIPDDDMDADFFADEDDYDADEYGSERRGGRKKLMAAVLVGAVVTGGGLAYIYKTSGKVPVTDIRQ